MSLLHKPPPKAKNAILLINPKGPHHRDNKTVLHHTHAETHKEKSEQSPQFNLPWYSITALHNYISIPGVELHLWEMRAPESKGIRTILLSWYHFSIPMIHSISLDQTTWLIYKEYNSNHNPMNKEKAKTNPLSTHQPNNQQRNHPPQSHSYNLSHITQPIQHNHRV